VGCAPDLVTNGETGAVFPFGNADALALVLKDLARDPARLRAMGEAARARVLEAYTIERSVEGTLQAVDCVLGRA
jgi:glycosyltransferase involved in cell wall biosynthesis